MLKKYLNCSFAFLLERFLSKMLQLQSIIKCESYQYWLNSKTKTELFAIFCKTSSNHTFCEQTTKPSPLLPALTQMTCNKFAYLPEWPWPRSCHLAAVCLLYKVTHTHTRARHSRTWTLQHVLSTSWTLIPPPTNSEQERERERGRGRRKQKRDESSNRRCTCKRWWSESGHRLGLELSSLFLRPWHKRHKTF